VARGQYPLASPDLYARHPSKREAGDCCERRLKFAALLGFLAWCARSGIVDRKTQRTPQEAARAAVLRQAPQVRSSQARSGIVNRKTPPSPRGRPRGRQGTTPQNLPHQPQPQAKRNDSHPHAKRIASRRKTMRKLPKAARAAGRERAPQDPPPPHRVEKNPKKTARPNDREIAFNGARRVGGRWGAGRR